MVMFELQQTVCVAKCIEMLLCDQLIRCFSEQAVAEVYLMKWLAHSLSNFSRVHLYPAFVQTSPTS